MPNAVLIQKLLTITYLHGQKWLRRQRNAHRGKVTEIVSYWVMKNLRQRHARASGRLDKAWEILVLGGRSLGLINTLKWLRI